MAVSTDRKILRRYLPTTIDMTSLSHSELLSLSLLSNTPSLSSNDTVFSSTDHRHSSFNESSSTHKQTFSSSPLKRHRSRHRGVGGGGGCGGGLHLYKKERSEFNLIVDYLKQYLEIRFRGQNSMRIAYRNGVVVDFEEIRLRESERNSRKRKRKLSGEEKKREKVSVEIVNRNGVVVDLEALAMEERENEGGPYGEELRRRAKGMEREEELLGMLGEMKGEWCSRRKKRRVVEACLLGDALPVGWKLIIALRRKAGRFFPYCRRYVSPTGEQLASCKEVSSYLQSYFGINDTGLLRDARGELCINSVESFSLVDISNSTVPDSRTHVEHIKDISDLDFDNLAEVRVLDLYECHPCNLSFHEKDKYLQHLLTFHRRTTKTYQLGFSVENSPFQMTDSTKLHCMDRLTKTTGISPMDALIEVAQCSIQEISPDVPELEPPSASNRDEPSKCKSISCPSELEMKKRSREVKTSSEKLNSCDKLSGISSDCPYKTEVEKSNGKDKASSTVPIPTCNEISEILTDGDTNDSGACFSGFGKVINQDKSSTKEPNPCIEVTAISVADINEFDSTFNEPGVKKDCGQKNFVSAGSNPCNSIGDILMTDMETSNGGYTWSRVVSENGTDIVPVTLPIVPVTLPVAKSGLHAVNAYASDAFSAKNEGSAMEHKLDCEQAQQDDDKELANFSGVSHAFACTEPQRAMNSSSPSDEASGKAEQYMHDHDLNLGSEDRTEYIELDVIEPCVYNTMNGGDPFSLSEVSMDMENSTRTMEELHSSIESQSEFQLGIEGRDLKTTCCVWCGLEFCHEVVDIELQPDSVGFMCPTCRNKISKQFNELDNSFSLDAHYC